MDHRFDMLDRNEEGRLERLYEQLREKLLDLTKKNRMLNYALAHCKAWFAQADEQRLILGLSQQQNFDRY